MYTFLEFHGRLSRSDKRPANPGRYDLQFQIHPTMDAAVAVWTETLKNIEVAPGGFYYVVLGQKTPLAASLFGATPRWLSVRVVAAGKRPEEHSSRVPVLGQTISLGDQVSQLELRMAQLESAIGAVDPLRSRRDAGAGRFRDWAEELQERVSALETQGAGARAAQLIEIIDRLEALDGEEGRVAHLEDELEDIVGPDGDIVDLNERMDLLEDRAPDLIRNLRAREGETGRERIHQIDEAMRALRDRVAEVDRTLIELRAKLQTLQEAPPPGPEVIGAVRKTGDTMSGGLVIQRGGLEVAHGALSARSAELGQVEASVQLKTPKVIAEAVELRGDLSVDTTKRVLQARLIEGRHSSGKRDGPLHLNTRGGGEVVIGNTAERKGLEVHGSIAADGVVTGTGGLAQSFAGHGLEPGDVVRSGGGDRVERCEAPADPRVIGVVTAAPALLLGGPLGDGRVAVALHGVVPCRVDAEGAPIRPGDLLVSGAVPGHARRAEDGALGTGAIFAKALEGLSTGRGTIQVLITGR